MKKHIKTYLALMALVPGAAAAAESPYALADSIVDSYTVDAALGEKVPFWNYTGSISTVTAEELSYWEDTSLDNALIGKLAGYYNNGAIRGMSSSNGEPILLVLDGVPAPTLTLSAIDPKSIAKVSILKDAAAKALYGPQGAQGVILVETKRGHDGKTTVKVNANFGWQQPTKRFSPMGSYDYAQLRNRALYNDGLPVKFNQSQLDAFAAGKGIDNDWTELYMNKFRPAQSYNIEVAGGNEKTTFFVNAGYDFIGSLYKADFKEKYNPEHQQRNFNLTSGINVKMFPFMTMFANTSMRIGHDNSSRTGESTIIRKLYQTPPTVEDGMENGHVIADETFPDPIYGSINRRGVNKITTTDINANFGLDFDLGFLTEGLFAKFLVGYNSYYSGTREGTYDYSRWVRDENGELVRLGTNNDDPLAWKKVSWMTYFMNFQATVGYQRTFGKHFVDAFVNYLGEDKLGASDKAAWLLPYTRIQLGGHVKYGFDRRYYLQFDFTHSGSEMMKEGYQFHFSPTGSLAWVVSNESFLRDADWLDLLKIRGSFGALEYDVLQFMPSRYLYDSEYRAQGSGPIYNIYTCALVGEGILGNPEVKWEKSYQQDYGFDLVMLDNSLSVNFDYWRTNQRGVLLQDRTIPMISGVESGRQPYRNIGRIFSEGVDLQASYTRRFGEVGFTFTGQMGWNRNRVDYGAEVDYSGLNYAYGMRETGYPIGQAFGYLVDYSNGNGYYNSQDEIDRSGLVYQATSPRPGDLRYRDLNNDGRIDEADKAPLDGVKDMPNFNYGASVLLTWRDFDFYMFWQGESGRNGYYAGLGVYENVEQGVYTDLHRHSWTAERYAAGQVIEYPALTSSTSSSLQNNDFFTSKADYVRLKNVTLGYSLPKKWMKAIGFNKVRFYFTGQNLFSASNLKFKTLDPETKSLTSFIYRSYNFGVNVSF